MNTKKGKIFVSLAALTAFVVGLVSYANRNSSQNSPQVSDNVSAPITETPTGTDAQYKDGTYTAVGTYRSPAGNESVSVTLTLANGIVTDASVTSNATVSESMRYQQRFISGFKPYVVGKSISSINLTKVSGSSLTPKGFNDALTQIEAQAQA